MRIFFIITLFILSINEIFAENWKVVAHVDDGVILNTDVIDRAELFKKLNKSEYNHYFSNHPSLFMREMQDLLINEILIDQEANRFNITVTDNEIFSFLIHKGMFQNRQMINDFIYENDINVAVWLRSLRFHILIERFKQIFFEREATITPDEENMMRQKFDKDNKIYHVKQTLIDRIDITQLEHLNCNALGQQGEDFMLHFMEMNAELKYNFLELQKKNFVMNDGKNVIFLCYVTQGMEKDFDNMLNSIFQQRISRVIDDFFDRLRHKYVTLETDNVN